MYEGYDKLRHDLEQNVKERGRRDRVTDAAQATDEQLWTLADRIMPAAYGSWAEYQKAIDDDPAVSTCSTAADMLIELRDWYDDARNVWHVDLRQLAAHLEQRGYQASTAYDCGGVWLLHVGPEFPDAENVDRPAVTLGGDMTFESNGVLWCSVVGMSVGTGDRSLPDAEQIQETIAEKPWRIAELADVVIEVLGRELERRGYDGKAWAEHERVLDMRVANAVEAAELAFWSAVAVRFPEIKTGDVDPGLTVALEQLMKRAVADWAECNGPADIPWAAGTTEPVILESTADQQAHAADLVRRAEQMQGRTLRPGNGGQEVEMVVIHLCDEECGNEAHPKDGRTMTQCNGCGAEDNRCCDCKPCGKPGCVCTTNQQD